MSFNELRERGTADFPIELYYVDKQNPRYEMVSHWHNEFEIIRILRGSLDIRLNNTEFVAEAGDILFVSPEMVHGAIPYDCVYECLDFYLDYLSVSCDGSRYFFDGLLNNEYIIKERITDGDIADTVNEIFENITHKSKGYKFKVIGGLYRLFGQIVDKGFYRHIGGVAELTADKNMLRLKTVLSFMRNNYDKAITLKNMADSVDMSPKYFCYFFREMTHKSPVEYLTTYRIEKASRKLINTDESVTDIAYSCGFNDLSYFIKTFKQHKGITPAKFRKGL